MLPASGVRNTQCGLDIQTAIIPYRWRKRHLLLVRRPICSSGLFLYIICHCFRLFCFVAKFREINCTLPKMGCFSCTNCEMCQKTCATKQNRTTAIRYWLKAKTPKRRTEKWRPKGKTSRSWDLCHHLIEKPCTFVSSTSTASALHNNAPCSKKYRTRPHHQKMKNYEPSEVDNKKGQPDQTRRRKNGSSNITRTNRNTRTHAGKMKACERLWSGANVQSKSGQSFHRSDCAKYRRSVKLLLVNCGLIWWWIVVHECVCVCTVW